MRSTLRPPGRRSRLCRRLALLAAGGLAVAGVAVPTTAASAEGPNAVVTVSDGSGGDACQAHTLPPNDDGYTDSVPLGFAMNFFGTSYDHAFVNNNGNITFDNAMSTYTPFNLLSTATPIIAPYFGDVDTRGGGASPLTYSEGVGTWQGRPTFCVDWVNVGYYSFGTDKLNSFQLLLVDRSDVAPNSVDIIFNYDKVQWEAGGASGGNGGLGGSSARAGYSNGTSASLELPGSAVNGAFLDSNPGGGLIAGSRGTTQLGRYIFPVRNGAAPTGHAIGGIVHQNDATGPGVDNAFVSVCTANQCGLTRTAADGSYSVSGLNDGTYGITVNPPAGSALNQAARSVSLNGADVNNADVVLTGPQPLPGNTTITSVGSNTGVPTVYWGNPLVLTTQGCPGGTASYALTQGSTVVRSGPMAESPAGTYSATIAPLSPVHGAAHIAITIVCPGGATPTRDFDMYIDPSGTVQDQNGAPVSGASVTLLRSDSSAGPFTAVPDGSALMSPGNRANPSTTTSNGLYGWDVLPGFYKVRAAKSGCTGPGGASSVDSGVLTIPPAVTGLTLTLTCPVVTGGTYGFTGFYAPTSNTATNSQRVGQPFTVQWSLARGGSPVSALSSFTSVDFGYLIVPNPTRPGTYVFQLATPSSQTLSYDAGAGRFGLTMVAPASWAGKTMTMTVKLDDGTLHKATYAFRS